MLGYFALYSRVFVLICAAVMLFIMCPDAARASPTMTQEHSGVKHNVLRRPLTIINHQSNPLQFTQGSLALKQNSPDSRQSRVTITKMQRGHSAGGARPAGGMLASHLQHGGQSFDRLQSREDYNTHSQDGAQTGDSYHSYSAISRKSSPKTAGSPFQSFSQIWDHGYTQESNNEGEVPQSDSANVDEDKSVGNAFYSSLFPSKTGGSWSTPPPAPRGHHSSYKETDELPADGPQSTSSGIQSSKFLSFSSRATPHATSISNGPDASVIKRNPRPEKLTSSITDFSQGLDSVSSSETLTHKKVQSYLFKDSQTSVNTATSDGQEALSVWNNVASTLQKQMPPGAQVYSRFSSNLHRKDPAKQDDLLYLNTNVGEYGGQTHNVVKYQPISSIYLPLHITAQSPTQLSLHPASQKSKNMESSVPTPHAKSQDSYVSSETSVLADRVNTTTRESMHDYKPGVSAQSIYGFRWSKNPVKGPSVPPSEVTSNSQRYSFDKGQDYNFKAANMYPSLSAKYSFGWRRVSTTTTPPAKLEALSTSYSSPSGVTSEVIKKTASTPRPFTSGFKDMQHLYPASEAGVDRNPDHRQFKTYKRMYSLKGFGTRPLEGAKTLQIDKSATLQQGFQRFNLMRSQAQQPKNIRWHSRTGEAESVGSDTSSVSQNEISSEDLGPPLKTESVPRFTPGKRNSNIYTLLGFQSIQNRTTQRQNTTRQTQPPTASQVSSGYLSSAGGLTVEPSPTWQPGTPNKNKPVPKKTFLLNTFTRVTVRGKPVRVKHTNSQRPDESRLTSGSGNAAIVRLPKHPARAKDVTHADIVGSASFTGVRATSQTPITPAGEEYVPNLTATIEQIGNLSHRSSNSDDGAHGGKNTTAEAHAEDGREEFSRVDENKLGNGDEDDNEIRTLGLFLDNKGGGGGGFNLSDLLSADAGSQTLGEDLAELIYLQTSTVNVSFKSVRVSRPDEQ